MNHITIPELNTMSELDVIRTSVFHVLTNGEPSVKPFRDEGYICAYDGIGCAAAPFMTAEARTRETQSWSHLPTIGSPHRNLISLLQSCHDNAAIIEHVIHDFCKGAEFITKYRINVVTIIGERGQLILAEWDART